MEVLDEEGNEELEWDDQNGKGGRKEENPAKVEEGRTERKEDRKRKKKGDGIKRKSWGRGRKSGVLNG